MSYVVYRREYNEELTELLTTDDCEQAIRVVERLKKFVPADYEIKKRESSDQV